MPQSLFVFAEITPKQEFFDDARDAILGIVQKTRKETGCKLFDVFLSMDGSSICLFEEWKNQRALDDHYAQPYTAAVFKSYEQWLTKAPSIHKMSHAEGN